VINKSWIALAALGVLALAGCSSMETQADEQGVRYEGGVLFAQAPEFKSCQLPSQQSYGDPGDGTYIYPAGQRTLKFSVDPGSDAPPITVSAPSPGGGQPITLTVSGVVTFTPNFTDCAIFQQFHEQIGRKFSAWTPEGWAQMIGTYIKDPTDRAADNAALGSNWVALASDEAAKAAWERAVAEALPAMIRTLSGGNYFTINGVLLQRPELPADVVAAIQRTEAARQEAQTAEQVRRAAETFPGGIAAYQAFQQQQAINDAIRSGNVKVLPVPQGSPIIVNPGG
jgi:hypothetical protein